MTVAWKWNTFRLIPLVSKTQIKHGFFLSFEKKNIYIYIYIYGYIFANFVNFGQIHDNINSSCYSYFPVTYLVIIYHRNKPKQKSFKKLSFAKIYSLANLSV